MVEDQSLQFRAECSVLGSILLEPDLLDECYLQSEEFFIDEKHPIIMEYFRYLQEIESPIDPLVIAENAGKNIAKIGGIPYLFQLRDSVPTVANFDYYQGIIREAYIKRRTVGAMQDMANAGIRDAVSARELISRAQSALEDIADLTETSQMEVIKISDVLKGHDKIIRKRQDQKGITGAKTASEDLDKLTGGHQDEDLEIIAARPSMGKTAFIVNDMLETARAGRPAALFSLEMSSLKIAERFVCAIGNIDNTKLRTGMLSDSDWERWSYAIEELDRLPIFIDDTPGLSLQNIQRKVKELKKKNPRIVIYIDYLQLVLPGRKFNKNDEAIAHVSKGLKQVARKNVCPVVAISAVSRDCEKRQDKRPLMSDLRESGSIESDADIIIFLYRDDYYNSESSKKGIIELILAKGRNVGTGTVEMVFNKKTGKFLNLDRSQHEKKAGDGNGGSQTGNRGAGRKGGYTS